MTLYAKQVSSYMQVYMGLLTLVQVYGHHSFMLDEKYRRNHHKRVKVTELLNERHLMLLSVVNILQILPQSEKQSVTYRPNDLRNVNVL